MNQSEKIGDLVAALAKAQLEFAPALKDSDNPQFNSKYADLAVILDAVRPALNRQGIAIVQSNGSDLERMAASVRTSLHFGEQWIASEAQAPAMDRGGKFHVQTLGAAWTYLRRYTLQAICGLASEDDDGNSLGVEGKKPSQIEAEKKWDKIDPPSKVKDVIAAVPNVTTANKLAPAYEGTWIVSGDRLTCILLGYQEKMTKPVKGNSRPFIQISWNGRYEGFNGAFVFHASLFDAIKLGVNKEVTLQLRQDGKFLNVEDVLSIDGVEYTEGHPIDFDEQLKAATHLAIHSDIPF